MTKLNRTVEINVSGIRVAGVGGLGLVAMAVVVSAFLPAAGWTMAAGLSGGVLLAVALVVVRRTWKSKDPSGDDPKILFRETEAASGQQPATDERASHLAPRYSTL